MRPWVIQINAEFTMLQAYPRMTSKTPISTMRAFLRLGPCSGKPFRKAETKKKVWAISPTKKYSKNMKSFSPWKKTCLKTKVIPKGMQMPKMARSRGPIYLATVKSPSLRASRAAPGSTSITGSSIARTAVVRKLRRSKTKRNVFPAWVSAKTWMCSAMFAPPATVPESNRSAATLAKAKVSSTKTCLWCSKYQPALTRACFWEFEKKEIRP